MCASSYRSGMIGWKGGNQKGDGDFHTVKSIEKRWTTGLTHSQSNSYVPCMQLRWFNMFSRLQVFGISSFFSQPHCPLTPFFFSYRTSGGGRIGFFNYSNPFFHVPFDSLSSLKIVIKGKYTQNAGKFFSSLRRRRRRKKEARRTNESETCIINLCAALYALLHS